MNSRSALFASISLFSLLSTACRHASAPAPQAAAIETRDGAAPASAHEIATDHGVVRGVAAGGSIAFRGIPYAAPPVGALRFSPPADAARWTAPRDATEWGACCPQWSGDGVGGQEDCLTLNVWTPAAAGAPRPVLVFLHGGGNSQGCSAHETLGLRTYEGDVLAARGVVVVTLNYRIGVLGFMTHEALGAHSSNLGLRDQQAALAWVRKNIAAFGGDPARVLLFGESAGATDTCAQVVSPRAKGLFTRALLESEACPHGELAAAKKQGAEIAAKAGCGGADVAACLRARPIDVLVKSAQELKSVPIVDGDVLVEDPLATLAKGAHNRMPFIIGDNSEETLFWARNAPLADEAAYRAGLEQQFGREMADKILARYPVSRYPDAKQAYVAATTDAQFICPARKVARAIARGQKEPVYRYLFPHTLSTRRRARDRGAAHGLELLFVFGHLTPGGYHTTDGDAALSTAMQDYWTRFAASGDPNGAGAPLWQRYDATEDNYLVLDEDITMQQGLDSANCDFWDSVTNTR